MPSPLLLKARVTVAVPVVPAVFGLKSVTVFSRLRRFGSTICSTAAGVLVCLSVPLKKSAVTLKLSVVSTEARLSTRTKKSR